MLNTPIAPVASGVLLDPLEALAVAAKSHASSGQVAQVIFDLDDTLFLVKPRKQAIFRELAGEFAEQREVADALLALSESPIPYDVTEALATVGIETPDHVTRLTASFFARFFDGGYTRHDAPNEGAADFVVRLYDLGVQIIYLTGRPEDMLPRTWQTLADHGFPVDPVRTRLVLKEAGDAHLADDVFKGIKALEIATWGTVLAAFDNEPANLNAMHPALPDARYFLLETDHSPNPPALAMAVHALSDFRLERARLASALAATPTFQHDGWSLQVAANE